MESDYFIQGTGAALRFFEQEMDGYEADMATEDAFYTLQSLIVNEEWDDVENALDALRRAISNTALRTSFGQLEEVIQNQAEWLVRHQETPSYFRDAIVKVESMHDLVDSWLRWELTYGELQERLHASGSLISVGKYPTVSACIDAYRDMFVKEVFNLEMARIDATREAIKDRVNKVETILKSRVNVLIDQIGSLKKQLNESSKSTFSDIAMELERVRAQYRNLYKVDKLQLELARLEMTRPASINAFMILWDVKAERLLDEPIIMRRDGKMWVGATQTPFLGNPVSQGYVVVYRGFKLPPITAPKVLIQPITLSAQKITNLIRSYDLNIHQRELIVPLQAITYSLPELQSRASNMRHRAYLQREVLNLLGHVLAFSRNEDLNNELVRLFSEGFPSAVVTSKAITPIPGSPIINIDEFRRERSFIELDDDSTVETSPLSGLDSTESWSESHARRRLF